ncbi:MAG: DUF309 domain-containing protein [Polyangiaceae bacterium]
MRVAFDAGARMFDAGAFWDAHEAWEEHWRSAADPTARGALQGLIQIAAALHKLVVTNDPAAAANLFTKGLAKLDAVPADFEIDLAPLRSGAHACAHALAEGRFEVNRIPRLGRGDAPSGAHFLDRKSPTTPKKPPSSSS